MRGTATSYFTLCDCYIAAGNHEGATSALKEAHKVAEVHKKTSERIANALTEYDIKMAKAGRSHIYQQQYVAHHKW